MATSQSPAIHGKCEVRAISLIGLQLFVAGHGLLIELAAVNFVDEYLRCVAAYLQNFCLSTCNN